MEITGQQFIRLKKWQKGLLEDKDFYKFLASKVNEIPSKIVKEGTDSDAINYCIKKAIVKTNPHRVINFYSSIDKSRLENIKALRKSGIISSSY